MEIQTNYSEKNYLLASKNIEGTGYFKKIKKTVHCNLQFTLAKKILKNPCKKIKNILTLN